MRKIQRGWRSFAPEGLGITYRRTRGSSWTPFAVVSRSTRERVVALILRNACRSYRPHEAAIPQVASSTEIKGLKDGGRYRIRTYDFHRVNESSVEKQGRFRECSVMLRNIDSTN